MRQETVLVTGAAGFIGPQVVRTVLQREQYRVVVVDKLTYAARVDERGDPLSLKMVISQLDQGASSRYSFVEGDVCDPGISGIISNAQVDCIIHMAAESHVDRSTEGKPDFLQTEVFGTYNILEAVRRRNSAQGHKIRRVVLVSTDEVYGSIDRIAGCEGSRWHGLSDEQVSDLIEKHQFVETTKLSGGSPYAACKCGADILAGAYFNTFRWDPTNGSVDPERMPVMVTRGVNNFGPFQHPEKLIPMAVCTLLHPRDSGGRPRLIPVYDNGLAVREWLTTSDYARAIVHVMENGAIGEVYNVGSGNRCRNRDLLLAIFRACKDWTDAEDLSEVCFDASSSGGVARPGHDLCYSVACGKLRGLGWRAQRGDGFDAQVRRVVDWYQKNWQWWEPVWTSRDFTDYWDSKYRRIMDSSPGHFAFYTGRHANRSLNSALLGVGIEKLREVIIPMVKAKEPTWDKDDLSEATLREAMRYYSEYGDFSTFYIPADDDPTGGFSHIGGLSSDHWSFGPPAPQKRGA